MSNYRRAQTPGGSYFFTVVTYRRQPLLKHAQSRRMSREIIVRVRKAYPFRIDAWVLLPEHIHYLWTLPADTDFSKRWGVKAAFSKRVRDLFRREEWVNASKAKHRESTEWLRRFWEHHLRDQADFNRPMDYLPWNPVKQGHVAQVADWPYSTFHRYVRAGVYPRKGGGGKAPNTEDFGESATS